MTITAKKIDIHLDWEEASDLYFCIKRALTTSIQEHWHRFPDQFHKSEALRLSMLRRLGTFLGLTVDYDLAAFEVMLKNPKQE